MNAAEPEFWNPRYESGHTPWDFGGVQECTRAYLKHHPQGGRAFIPGCGAGHELAAFTEAGYDTTALDFSASAVALARQRLGAPLDARIVLGDFFQHNFAVSFDLAFERTFLCALPPARRPAYAQRLATLIRPGGVLVGLFFFEIPDADGPPWGLAGGELPALFAAKFTLENDLPSPDALPIFAGRERWQEWRRI